MHGSAETAPEAFLNILGVLYLHRRTSEGGDLYLTPFGIALQRQLDIANWLEPEWFQAHRERLEGTSTVYRVQTRPVDGLSADLVVKYCRVGEDVPLNTHTMREFMNAEFNSPWEEFALVMELRESRVGPKGLSIATQQPLAIHVPPEHLQLWQTGRSEERVNRIQRRHPGVALDILRQYQLVYGWIPGLDLMQTLRELAPAWDGLEAFAWRMNARVLAHLDSKGYAVADMKPVHIIFGDEELAELRRAPAAVAASAEALIEAGRYAMIDYELLQRTQVNEVEVNRRRRHSYLDILRDRFSPSDPPPHLHRVDIMGVPYIHGHVESTGGELWVVGRNPGLFDFFLPERWRRTPSVKLSERNDVHYTLSKDHVHLVWKVSRVGELPDERAGDRAGSSGRGFNSPFEECAAAFALAQAGVPTTNVRAIYRTGSRKLEASQDPSRYQSHAGLRGEDGRPLLRDASNYVIISGYFNGPDAWVAQREGLPLCRPIDLRRAVEDGRLERPVADEAVARMRQRIRDSGFDAGLLDAGDLLIAIDPDGQVLLDGDGRIEARLCDFAFISGRAWD
ncbi:MAG: hypothetical protein J0M02_12900 [Planctomycetes bacterium]|nr:hypothetical protein [Planctomycetota bacterium]